MQVTGTFPQLSAGMKKSKSRSKSPSRKAQTPLEPGGMSNFTMSRTPKRINAPKSLAGRRNASHRKAHGR